MSNKSINHISSITLVTGLSLLIPVLFYREYIFISVVAMTAAFIFILYEGYKKTFRFPLAFSITNISFLIFIIYITYSYYHLDRQVGVLIVVLVTLLVSILNNNIFANYDTE